MRSYRFRTLGSLDGLCLCEEPEPRPQRGELLLRVHACSLNYRDVAIYCGTYPYPCQPGLVPLSDAAAEVIEVGEGVIAYKAGDCVISAFHPRWFGGSRPSTAATDSYGNQSDGWLTELKVVSQEAVVRMPQGMSYQAAATLPCAGLTAWTALTAGGAVRAGQTVLTMGSGGVAIFALQLAKAFGARVIATTSSDAKAARLRALGADEVVNYLTAPDWGEQVRSLSGGGVDRVVEVGGPGTFSQSLRAVRHGGEVASIGFLTGGTESIDFYALKRSGAVVRQIGVGDRSGLEDFCRMAGWGLRPVIGGEFGFEQAREAFAALEARRHVGKIVIQITPP